jgi:glycosyltransferase involved in cell wall biosynthesis
MPDAPTASIVIPTRGRPDYLDVALGSIVPQAADAGAEVIVVSDGDEPASVAVAQRHGALLVRLGRPSGANVARNAGVKAARAALLVFTDDDIKAPSGWLRAILDGARSAPDHEAFGGPIRAVIAGGGPRACGRERPPITTLDCGGDDANVPMVWSANMAVRRSALDRVGAFDESLSGCGEEEDWLRRYLAAGGRVRYLARAGVDHRRTAGDATLRALARSAYGRGRAARRYDAHRGDAPTAARELRVLAGCAWHTVRRRCANGIVLGAHSAGRIREAMRRPADERA